MLSNYSRVPNRVRFIIYNDFSHDYDLFLTDYDLTWHYSLPIKGGYVYLFLQKKSHGYVYSTLEYDKNYEMKWKSKKKNLVYYLSKYIGIFLKMLLHKDKNGPSEIISTHCCYRRGN